MWRRYAIQNKICRVRIFCFISFQVSVHINKSGSNYQTRCIDGFCCGKIQSPSYANDLSVLYRNVAIKPTIPCAINNFSVMDDDVAILLLRKNDQRTKKETEEN